MKNNFDRLSWVDFAKGITILLVIVGHNVSGIIRGVIFSFHMPLFFILSCVTYKWSKDEEQFWGKVEKSFKHLIIPALLLSLVSIMKLKGANIVFNNIVAAKLFIKKAILMVIFASGVDVDVFGTKVSGLGLQWFLVVLFCGRCLFDYCNLKLKDKELVYLSIIFSVLGVFIGKIQKLPFSLDIVLAIFPLLLIGKYFDVFQLKKNTYKKFGLSFSTWLILLVIIYFCKHKYLELATREYTLFPLCYVIAIAGTIMISTFSMLVCQKYKNVKPLLYLGKNSLYMLCIHKVDYLWMNCFNFSNQYIRAILTLMIDLGVFSILMFFIEKWKVKNKQSEN